MPSDLPIACSLSADELPDRLRDMSVLGRASLLAVERDGARAVLRFRLEVKEELAAIVAAEAECCAFLSMQLHEAPDCALLTVHAPPAAEPLVREWVGAFSNEKQVA